jgi:hypothetical protein
MEAGVVHREYLAEQMLPREAATCVETVVNSAIHFAGLVNDDQGVAISVALGDIEAHTAVLGN